MRKASVELARLIACLLVIGVHVSLSTVVNDTYDASRLLSACLVADGVAIFWLISGFFMFNTKSYWKLLKRTFKNIVIPMIIFLIFCFFLSGYLVDRTSLAVSITHTGEDYLNLLKGFFSWNVVVSCSGHLWYLMVYFVVILMFPILKAYVDSIKQDVKKQKLFLIISSMLLIFNDISANTMAEFSHHSFNGAIPAAIFFVWGSIIYQHREAIKTKISFVKCVILFVGLNIVRLLIILNRQGHDYSYTNILYWYSFLGLICELCIIFACMFLINDNKESKINRVICWLSSYTFGIYIVHMLVVIMLDRYSIAKYILEYVTGKIGGAIGEYFYTIVMILLVFAISLCIIIVVKIIKKLALKIVNKR